MSDLPDYRRIVAAIPVILDDTISFGQGWSSEYTSALLTYTEVWRILIEPAVEATDVRRIITQIKWRLKRVGGVFDVYGKWQIGDGDTPSSWTDIGTERKTGEVVYVSYTEDATYFPADGVKKVTIRLVLKTDNAAATSTAQINLGASYSDVRAATL